ncbi:MAG: MFS transporter [Candidatus Poribacteria bacterium]|nr:MFS transporter [Candidatus Poribacteria bacterium]
MPKKVGDQRRNFRFALLQGTFMRINLAFADSSTVLPAFIHKLSGSDLLVGLTGSMMTAGWMWPQLLMSNLLEHRPRKMSFYALGMSVRVLAWLGIFFCTVTIGEQNPMLLAGSFLGLYFLSSSAMGVSTLPYMDIVSKAIEPQRRARFFSLRQLYGGFFAIWVGFLVRAVLGDESDFTGILGGITQAFKTSTMYFIGSICNIKTDLGFPYNYAFLFICSVTAAFLSFVSFLGVREPIHPVQATRQPISQHLKQGPHFLRTDANYRRFIHFRVFAHISGMASPFYIPYALDELGFSDATIGFFIVSSALSGVVSNTMWGYVGEKYGVRWVLIITAGMMGIPPILAFSSGILPISLQMPAFFLIFIVGGILGNGMMVGFMAYMLNIAPPRNRPTYIGFMNTLLMPVSFAPVLGGLLAPYIGYRWLFALSIGICFIAFRIATGLQEIMHDNEVEAETEA